MKLKDQLANLFTLGNLLSGVLVIIYSFQKDFQWVFVFASISLLLDFLDGATARFLQSNSMIGKDLDSLADTVSFGVAPGLVLYNYYDFSDWNIAALMLPLFAAYRLATFNVTVQSPEFFKGLPTPAMALGAFSIPLIPQSGADLGTLTEHPFFLITFCIAVSLLMVSPIPLFSLKPGSSDRMMNRTRVSFIFMAILLMVLFKFFGLFLCLIMYIVISLTIQKRLKQL